MTSFTPQAVYVRDLEVGDHATFDAIYGVEEVIRMVRHPRAVAGIDCLHIELRHQLLGESHAPETSRFIVRAAHEPTIRMVRQQLDHVGQPLRVA